MIIIGQRQVLQKEWDRTEKVTDLKKAILNRKIKPYNIETHLQGLSSGITAKEYKQLVGGHKQDVIKMFFVESKDLNLIQIRQQTNCSFTNRQE